MRRLGIALAAAVAALSAGGWAAQDTSSHIPPSRDDAPALKLREPEKASSAERTLPAPALSVPSAPAAPSIPDRDARWTQRPSDGDFDRYFPKKASREGVEGRATVVCLIGLDEALRDCEVESETPQGYGFGQAAVSIARRARMSPPVRGGQRREGRIRLPFVFNLAPPAPATARPMPSVSPTNKAQAGLAPQERSAGDRPQRPSTLPRKPPPDLSWLGLYLLSAAGGALAFVLLMLLGIWAVDRRRAAR